MIMTFETVKVHGTKFVLCKGCGKRLKRSTTFEQTINPFNKNEEGKPKTYYEIEKELKSERIVWEKEPVFCNKCKENGRKTNGKN